LSPGGWLLFLDLCSSSRISFPQPDSLALAGFLLNHLRRSELVVVVFPLFIY